MKKGFTLIELMLAIAIVALISAVFLTNLVGALARGRDSKRKQDLRNVSAGLELYYSDLGTYPTAFPTPGTAFTYPGDANTVYMAKVPGDPVTTKRYCYTSSSGTNYKMYANLENAKDPAVIPTVACSGTNYNFGISSANTTP